MAKENINNTLIQIIKGAAIAIIIYVIIKAVLQANA